MPGSGFTLPIRLVPRKRSQIMPLFAFTFAFVEVPNAFRGSVRS